MEAVNRDFEDTITSIKEKLEKISPNMKAVER